jgi:hypothetical protein
VRGGAPSIPMLLALALVSAPSAAAEAPAPPPTEEPRLDRALFGAVGPDGGDLVLHGAGGVSVILPHVTLAGRLGLGGGTGLELGYRNLAFFGQEGRLRFGWGTRANDWLDVGLALRSSISTLALADGDIIGIEFSSVPLGNDWEIGNDVVMTVDGPGTLFLTGSLGPTFTMGGLRPTGFEEKEFRFDAAIRAIHGMGIAEWGIGERTNVFLRFDAMFLLGVETDDDCVAAQQAECGQLVPIGFLPSASIGVGWAP